MCELEYEIHTVDFVAAEIINPEQKEVFNQMVASGKIKVDSFTSKEVSEIVEEYSAVSGNLSIPRRLRRYAEQQSIEVHGILFLFDEMVANSVISPIDAATKLEELMALNSRLPQAAIRERIDKWRGR